jgi:isopenicillin N synthase-like dioxygenase
MAIPVIDFADARSSDPSRRSGAMREIAAASRDLGMFLIADHGVPDALIDAHFAVARAFFALDLEEKRAIDVSRSNCFRGYEAFGTQTIDPATPGDLKEGFIMGPDLPPHHPHVIARFPNTGANIWPRRPAGMRAHMERYVDAMNELGREIAAALARSLGLSADYFRAALTEPLIYSQLLYYPALPAEAGENRFGAGAHVDWGMLTILLQDDVGGLEVRARDGTWYAAPPVPRTFVIILGEMWLRLTNGAYRSATHRVARNTSGRGRYSMPTFFDPAYDERIACIPQCAPATGEPRYAACTVAEHMLEMARATLTAGT